MPRWAPPSTSRARGECGLRQRESPQRKRMPTPWMAPKRFAREDQSPFEIVRALFTVAVALHCCPGLRRNNTYCCATVANNSNQHPESEEGGEKDRVKYEESSQISRCACVRRREKFCANFSLPNLTAKLTTISPRQPLVPQSDNLQFARYRCFLFIIHNTRPTSPCIGIAEYCDILMFVDWHSPCHSKLSFSPQNADTYRNSQVREFFGWNLCSNSKKIQLW